MKGFHTFDDLFWKYMLAYKKRTVFSILGITLSVVLFFGAGTIYTSIRHANYERCKEYYGDYDAEGYVNPDQYQKMRGLKYIDTMLLSMSDGQLFTEDRNGTGEMTITIQYLDRFDQDIFSYELLEGDYPQNSREILLNQYQADYFQVKPGDTMDITYYEYWYEGKLIGNITDAYIFRDRKFDDEGGEKLTLDDMERKEVPTTYRISGIYDGEIWERSYLDIYGYTDFLSLIDRGETYNELYVVVRFRNHKNCLNQLSEEGIYLEENTVITEYLPGYPKYERLLEYILFMIVFIILFWIAVIIIRNMFVMSMAERARDYGILLCMGTSKYRLRRLLLKEGLAMAVIGNILGFGLTALLLELGKYMFGIRQMLISLGIYEYFHVYPRWWVAGASFALIVSAVLFSLLEPARQIGVLSPIEAINGNASIRKEKIKRSNTGWIRKILGIEGEYASKNLLRNKGKFIVSTVGIMFSVVGIVISFSIFDILKYVFDIETLQMEYSGSATFRNGEGMTDEDIDAFVEKLMALRSVEDAFPVYGVSSQYITMSAQANGKLKKDNYVFGGYSVGIEPEELAELESVLLEGSLDYDAMEQGGVIICQNRWTWNIISGERIDFQHVIERNEELHVGDWLAMTKEWVYPSDFETEEEYLEEVNRIGYETYPIIAVLEYCPLEGRSGDVILYAKEYYQREYIVDIKRDGTEASGLDNIEVKFSNWYDIGEIQEFLQENRNYRLFQDDTQETIANMKGYQRLILLVAIIIAGIGSMNIFNTLSSNIALRHQEFQIMRTIGMSRKQIVKMLGLEGGLAAILGSILGIALGLIVGYWLTKFSTEIVVDTMYYDVDYHIPWMGILISVLLAATITSVSLWIAKKDIGD